ncbi:HEPN domain-containing protein [Streptomyces sp. NRRL B-3229]|uniref:HEPN domain-containing protein n=1 Tax=Streptomyces sp. NRRL B-3229 TaxID=1463836 RepID=UPI00131EA0AA|nr:HEPN domain-containing protein [Streptomyces sp. NRRL B-3229]
MSTANRPVELLYQDQKQMLDELQLREPSFHATLQTMLPKMLMLAAASEFEHFVCSHIRDYVAESSSGDRISFLVERKAINRQYHTYFDWPKQKAGTFWALFGPEFKKAVESKISEEEDLSGGLKAFLEVGSVRNNLVHNNYADVTISYTLAEVHKLYTTGCKFVDALPSLLRIEVETVQSDS